MGSRTTSKKSKADNPTSSLILDGPPPDFVEPQLAKSTREPPVGPEWVHELKLDGHRFLIWVHDGRVRILSRENIDHTESFRIIADEITGLKLKNALFDGEMIAYDADGKMSPGAVTSAKGKRGRKESLHYYAFDLLHLNGESLIDLPLLERKKRLRKILPKQHLRIHFVDHFKIAGQRLLEAVCKGGYEGIISKLTKDPYRPSRRTWYKCKCKHGRKL